jgi:predicted TIM-barrel fold metal-dependent hydrolase
MSLSEEAKHRVTERLKYLESARDKAVIDGDTHPSDPDNYTDEVRDRLERSPNYYHGRPISGSELIEDMDQAGVDMALCWQNPAILRYGADQDENFRLLLEANRAIERLAKQHPTRVIPAGWTDPKALGMAGAAEIVRLAVDEWGFPVVKMNPAQNGYYIDDPQVMTLVDEIVGRGAVPAFHFGADTPFTPANGLRSVALRYPNHPVIGVHMGGGGAAYVDADDFYQAARELGLQCPNLFFILSAKRDTHMESDLITYRAAGSPWCHNLSVGSDAPYGRVDWNFGGFKAIFAALANPARHSDPRLAANPGLFDREAVQDFMGRNLANLVIGAYRRLLSPAR